MVTIGAPFAPFLMGFVAYRVEYRWIYWILSCTNTVQFILYFVFGPETRYICSKPEQITQTRTQKYFHFSRIDPTPLTWRDFIHPFSYALRPCVAIPAVAYAMVFLLASIMIAIEIPQVFVDKFHFNTQQIGLQNISLLVGSLLGEQLGGFSSDQWMLRRQRKTGHMPHPEFRLWLSYAGYLLAICGIVVFLVCLGQAGDEWTIAPLIGAAIAAAGNQVVTTVLITYAVDCYYEEAASIGVFITFVRQTWGFIGPFWFPQMLENVGFYRSNGICIALIVAVSVIPTTLLQWRGKLWH